MNNENGTATRYPIPPFLVGENPAHEQYHEAIELFALFGYLKAQRFGVFSIRESLQAVGERIDGTLQGFHLSEQEAWECIAYMASLGVGVIELPAYPANRYGQALNHALIARAREAGLDVEFAAHARCVDEDIEAARRAGFRRVHLYMRGQLYAADLHADGIGIPDTVGISTLRELGDRIAVLRRVGIEFSFLECHVHNDIGNADRTYVDTLLLCMRLGITMLPDFSILGIGERNGTIGLSSLLEAIYRRLILLYPQKMTQIRQAMREKLGTLPSGELFVNRYRDMDAYFYRIMARLGFVFDRSPFSANTEFDGSGVHADTTMRAYLLAHAEGNDGQQAIDIGNSAYSGALPPYDMPLRTPVLACFGCGKSNVRYWRERERLALRPEAELRERVAALEDIEDFDTAQPLSETAIDELIAQLIRCYSIKLNGITHQDAMELVGLFYAPAD